MTGVGSTSTVAGTHIDDVAIIYVVEPTTRCEKHLRTLDRWAETCWPPVLGGTRNTPSVSVRERDSGVVAPSEKCFLRKRLQIVP